MISPGDKSTGGTLTHGRDAMAKTPAGHSAGVAEPTADAGPRLEDGMPAIARIEPLTTARALRGPFDYRLGDEHADVAVGATLEVPFGGRSVLGVVTGTAAESAVAPEKLAAPLRRLEASVPADLVELALWMADEYCSTPARALQLVLPPGGGRGRPRQALVAEITADGLIALDGGVRLTDGQTSLLRRLRDDGPCRAATLGAAHAALRRLESRGLVVLAARPWRRRPRAAAVRGGSAAEPDLTGEQRAVLEPILGALEGDRAHRRFLLHGVTGSGKTEIYLRAAAAALEMGGGVLVLVPEIALTPQTVARFESRFGETVAVLHSGLAEGERGDEWRRLASGEARICVGPRSAVFAPLAELALVVVDEEHEASYKHEGDPRYDARRVAERRAEQAGAVLVAGSATPRAESVEGARRLRLGARIDDRPLPAVQVLDMRDCAHALHPRTREALADVSRARGKAIVLLNRRGWSNFLSCRSCGRVWECPQCDVALVLHQRSGAVSCHHCGHHEPVPGACPDCRSTAVARHGAGTERVEAELADALAAPDFPVLRLDADAAAAKDGTAKTLEAFEAARAGVLVGTQMVAKGHDFPDVTLGVVLDADATLRFPDFRAEERTFALITQLAGRAGRGPGGGRVLVQTLAPDAPAINHAAQHDSDGFITAELARRRALGYPPYASVVRVVCSAPDSGDARRAADALAARISAPGATVLGPAPLFRLRGLERSQLAVKAADRAAAIASIGAAVEAVARTPVGRAARLSVDVDPV
jgi:primosomal protein N' (replication factor Y)